MELRADIADIDGSPTLELEGIADLSSLGQLRDALAAAIAAHPGEVLTVDLDGLAALDDSALGLLLGAAATARDRGGDLAVACASPSLRARFERTRLDRAIEVRQSVAG